MSDEEQIGADRLISLGDQEYVITADKLSVAPIIRERILLRGVCLRYADDRPDVFGVCLPDERFVLFKEGKYSIGTYSSERALRRHCPDAEIIWLPDGVNEVLNHIDSEEGA